MPFYGDLGIPSMDFRYMFDEVCIVFFFLQIVKFHLIFYFHVPEVYLIDLLDSTFLF